jgi:ketosteroid isomerase-like protein
MKPFLRSILYSTPITIIAITLFHFTGCSRQSTIDLVDEHELLQQRQNDFLSALSSKDLERTLDHYADDAVVHIANMPPIHGSDAIRQLYENVFRFLSESEYTPDPLRISESADLAYGTGSVTNVFEGAEGLIEYPGKYLIIWGKRDDVWKVVVYSVSNNRSETSR